MVVMCPFFTLSVVVVRSQDVSDVSDINRQCQDGDGVQDDEKDGEA